MTTMSINEIIFAVLTGWSVLLTAFIYAAIHIEKARRDAAFKVLLAHPRSPVRFTEDGQLVKLAGRIEPSLDPMLSPIFGQRCVYWRALVYTEGRISFDQPSFDPPVETHLVQAQGCDFLLRDGTGVAMVRVEGAQIAIHFHPRRVPKPRRARPSDRPKVEEWLRRHGKREYLAIYTTEETVLPEGVEVAVLGVARWEPGGYRDAPRRLVLHPPPDGLLLLSQDPQMMR